MFGNLCAGFLGYSGWGGTVMGLLMLVIPVLLIVFLIRYMDSNRNKSSSETALETVKIRYAKGEILKDEFDKIRNDLTKQ